MDRSDRCPPRGKRPRFRRLVDLSSPDPIRWRPRADPVQKQVPGDRTKQKGIDQSRPVTEGWAKASSPCPREVVLHVETLRVGTARRAPLPTLQVRHIRRPLSWPAAWSILDRGNKER